MPEQITSLVVALRRQLESCVVMLRAGMEACDDQLWDSRKPGPPPWEQIYHTLFWMGGWLRDWSQPLVNPPYHVPEALGLQGEPSSVIGRADLRRYYDDTWAMTSRYLDGLTDDAMLTSTLAFGKAWTPVDRILAQVRHVQHHVGYLNAVLRARGSSPAAWVGFQEL